MAINDEQIPVEERVLLPISRIEVSDIIHFQDDKDIYMVITPESPGVVRLLKIKDGTISNVYSDVQVYFLKGNLLWNYCRQEEVEDD